MRIKGLAAATVNHLGFVDTYAFFRRKLTKSQVAILMYHRVCPKNDNWSLEPLSPRSFERQLQYFCRNYEILALDGLVQYLQQGKSLPEKAVVLTFDDGYKDNYLYAYPFLKKYHTPATIFLATGYIVANKLFWWDKVNYAIEHTTVAQINLAELGNYSLQSQLDKRYAGFTITEGLKKLSEERKNLMIEKLFRLSGVQLPADLGKELILSWDEIKEMSNGGVTFGAHSVNHPVLTNMPLKQAKYEIIQSKKDIERRIGNKVRAFSYPNGNFNAELIKFIKKSGFTGAVAISPSKLITFRDSPYELGRIGAIEDFNKFKVVFCGLWRDLQSMLSRGSIRNAKNKRLYQKSR